MKDTGYNMTRLKIFITLFFLAVSIPISAVLWQTYTGLQLEEQAQMQYFSDTIFDRMEQELSEIILQEENRSVEEYSYYLGKNEKEGSLSPLSTLQDHPYILGYMQNNPDNSFQTPHLANQTSIPADKQLLYSKLTTANTIFIKKKFAVSQIIIPLEKKVVKPSSSPAPQLQSRFSERYLSKKEQEESNSYLGRKVQRVEKVSQEQAYNVFQDEKSKASLRSKTGSLSKLKSEKDAEPDFLEETINMEDELAATSPPPAMATSQTIDELNEPLPLDRIQADAVSEPVGGVDKMGSDSITMPTPYSEFEVEVAPFQSISINNELVYVFRRVVLNNQIYRQGFFIEVEKLLTHLMEEHFSNQPLADFAAIRLFRSDINHHDLVVQGGLISTNGIYSTSRSFPAPFSFLQAVISSNQLPESPARQSLDYTIAILILFMLSGLTAIYFSVKAIVDMAEKRSQFVSSVTHELKTPLTNIRMYIEMLQQGIAATPKQEQEYLEILGNESTRLSGLINNVLDLAKLEKKQRCFHLQEGDFNDVLTEVETICSHQLMQDGFTLHIQSEQVRFTYDREVMIQILLNLIENSVKFSKNLPEKVITIVVSKRKNGAEITVSDTGPGIPSRSIKKIFNDFYRADNDLTRETGGTGIGLALVKKFITAMGGTVSAQNNSDAGCTITLHLP